MSKDSTGFGYKSLLKAYTKKHIVYHKEFTQMMGNSTQALLLLHLLSLEDDFYEKEQHLYSSDKKLAWELGLSEASVKRAREYLFEKQYMRWERRGYKGKNHFTFDHDRINTDLEEQLRKNKIYELQHNPCDWGAKRMADELERYGHLLESCLVTLTNSVRSDRPNTTGQCDQTLLKRQSKRQLKSLLKESHSNTTHTENLMLKGEQLTEEAAFEMLYDEYGYKRGKKEAQVAFLRLIQQHSVTYLIERAKRAREEHAARTKVESKPPHRPYLVRWLNNARFEDEIEAPETILAQSKKGMTAGALRQNARVESQKFADTILKGTNIPLYQPKFLEGEP